MSETAHTPGPWRIDEDDRDGMEWNIHIVEEARPHHRVCFMASDGPNEANARLIAAAPDMLAALKVAHEQLTWATKGLECEELDQSIVTVAAAIARAEGRT